MQVVFIGPDMAKFATALREIGTYKEVLRSQVSVSPHICTSTIMKFFPIKKTVMLFIK